MQLLADFLNHGILPFVGRTTETEAIVRFWRGTFDASELRAMLVVGEAGIGKSRLVDRVLHRVVDSGGSVVHVKLYPDATVSLLSLVARALWHPSSAQTLLASEPAPTLTDIGAALLRLCRLRPTLLVIEDLHLLSSGGELTRLLRLVGDEALSLLAVARPQELPARSAIEPYIVDELRLDGLSASECSDLWALLAGSDATVEVESVLHERTAGNPLALRSALRGVIRATTVTGAVGGGRWDAPTRSAQLAQALDRSVGLLAEAMTADLDAIEIDAARRIAVLGEVFSREAARIVLGDDDTVVDALLFKGIIATATASPAPLPTAPSDSPPLVFTHTLLHRQLVDPPLFDAATIVRVVASAPLYSLVPFSILARSSFSFREVDVASVQLAFDRTSKVQIALRRSPLWRGTNFTTRTACNLLASHIAAWPQDAWETMLVKLTNHRINISRTTAPDEYERWLHYLEELTATADTDPLAIGRLNALMNRIAEPELSEEAQLALFKAADDLVRTRPYLRPTFAYTDFVIYASVVANADGRSHLLQLIEKRVDEILESDELPAHVRVTFERQVRPPLLVVFDSEETAALRLEQITTLERLVGKNEISVWSFAIDVLADMGLNDAVDRICAEVMPHASMLGLSGSVSDMMVCRLRLRAGRGLPVDDIIAEVADAAAINQLGSTSMTMAVESLLLLDEVNAAERIFESFGDESNTLPAEHSVLLRQTSGADALEGLGFGASDASTFLAYIGGPVLRLGDIVRARVIVRNADRLYDGDELILAAAADLFARSMAWLSHADRQHFAFMQTLLADAHGMIDQREITAWSRRISLMAAGHQSVLEASDGGQRMRLTMLGSIAIQRGADEVKRFQGARVRTLLSMMVAECMIPGDVDVADFARLVAGDELAETESARNILKTTVHRLREAIGHNAVLTDESNPRLNRAVIDVDILEAHALVRRASVALVQSSPMQAQAALMQALLISRGEVPFPSQFDDFIEAVRTDFENEMRNVCLDVVGALVREGGTNDAISLLRSACTALPGDGELSELLHHHLSTTGRNVEAELVRRRTEDVM